MAEVGSVFVSVVPSARGFASKLSSQTGAASTAAGRTSGAKFGKVFATTAISPIRAFGAAAVGIFAGAKVVGFLKDSVNEASGLAESGNKIDAVFGKASSVVERFASGGAEKLGQTRLEVLNAASTFGTFGKAAGLGGRDLAKFSTGFASLSTDLASFYNTSPEQAVEAIGAALRGEAEPVRQYGVMLNDATLRQEALRLGLIKNTKTALTPQQKVLAAQAAIMRQTRDAQGDFQKTSGGLANQQRILAARFTDVKASIGEALLPAVNRGVGVLSNFVKGIQEGTGAAGQIRAALEGAGRTVAAFISDFRAGEGAAGALRSTLTTVGAALAGVLKFAGGGNVGVGFVRLAAAAGTALIAVRAVRLAILGIAKARAFSSATVASVRSFANAVRFAAFATKYYSALAKDVLVRGGSAAAAGFRAAAASALSFARASVAAAISGARTAASFVAQRAAIVATAVATKAAAAATAAFSAAQALLSVALRANPIILVATLLVALGAALVVAYKKSETFRAILQAAFAGVKAIVLPVVRAIVSFMSAAWPRIVAIVRAAAAAIRAVVTVYFKAYRAVVLTAMTAIRAVITKAWAVIRSVITSVSGVIKTVVSKAWSAVKSSVTAVSNSIKGTVARVWAAIKAAVSKAVSGVRAAVAGWSSLVSLVAGIFGRVVSSIKTAIGRAVDFVRGLPGKIVAALRGAASAAASIGVDIVNGIVRGIQGAAGRVYEAARNLASQAVQSIKDKLKIFSPSRVMRDEVGVMIARGLTSGMEKESGDVRASARNLAGLVGADIGRSLTEDTRKLSRAAQKRLALLRKIGGAEQAYARSSQGLVIGSPDSEPVRASMERLAAEASRPLPVSVTADVVGAASQGRGPLGLGDRQLTLLVDGVPMRAVIDDRVQVNQRAAARTIASRSRAR
ncbi:MAG: phage tail protein [Angustibacter sp.]